MENESVANTLDLIYTQNKIRLYEKGQNQVSVSARSTISNQIYLLGYPTFVLYNLAWQVSGFLLFFPQQPS